MSTDFSGTYLAVRHEWDERYGSIMNQRDQWRIAAFIAAATALFAVGGFIWQTKQSKVIPFVIALDGDKPVAVGRAYQAGKGDQKIVKAMLYAWIQDLRFVTTDPIAQRAAIDRVYMHLNKQSSAQQVISDWYRSTDPFARGRTETTTVVVHAVLPLSPLSWQVEWTETTRDLFGGIKSQNRWRGSFVTTEPNPAAGFGEEEVERVNPLGVYVTEANFGKVL